MPSKEITYSKSNLELISILSLCISAKRFKRNSVLITTKRKSKIAKEFGISVQTFNKYFEKSMENGWITSFEKNHKVINLVKILRDFKEKTGLLIFDHQIIKRTKTHDFNQVKKEIIDILIVDNVIRPQKYHINKANLLLRNSKTILSTEEGIQRSVNSPEVNKNYSLKMASIAKRIGYSSKDCDNMVKEVRKVNSLKLRNKLNVVSSCRHTSNIVGVSIMRANKALGTSKIFKRDIHDYYVPFVHPEQLESLKLQFPEAVVVYRPFINKIVVRFGSVLRMNNDKHIFNFRKKIYELI
jgi:AraC-like DNA-binding protein